MAMCRRIQAYTAKSWRTLLIVLTCLLAGCLAQEVTMTTQPSNMAVYQGNDVTLECSYIDIGNNPFLLIQWFECFTSGNGTCHLISYNDEIIYSGDVEKFLRYKLDLSNERSNLIITDVKTTDAGRYRCSSVLSPTYGDAELIVIEKDPVCARDFVANGPVTLLTVVGLVCEIRCTGRWRPIIKWMEGDKVINTARIKDTSTVDAVKQSISLYIERSHNDLVVTAEFSFNTPTVKPNEATNTPSYNYTHSYPALNVLFPPYNTTIDQMGESLAVGQTLTCTSIANPSASYTWQDENTEMILANTPVLTVTSEMIGCQMYSCAASNEYGEDLVMTSLFVRPFPGDIEKPLVIPFPAFIVIAVLLCISLMANILLVLYVCGIIGKPKMQQKNKSPVLENGTTESGHASEDHIEPKPLVPNSLQIAQHTVKPTEIKESPQMSDKHTASTLPDVPYSVPMTRKRTLDPPGSHDKSSPFVSPGHSPRVSPQGSTDVFPRGEEVKNPGHAPAQTNTGVKPELEKGKSPARKALSPKTPPKPATKPVLRKPLGYENVGDRDPVIPSVYDPLKLEPVFPGGKPLSRPTKSAADLVSLAVPINQSRAAASVPNLDTGANDGYEEIEYRDLAPAAGRSYLHLR